jgi:hypothetical protein
MLTTLRAFRSQAVPLVVLLLAVHIAAAQDASSAVYAVLSAPLQAQTGGLESDRLRIVDGVKYPRSSAGIQKAIDDLGNQAGAVILTPGAYGITSEIHIMTMGISVLGFGHSTQLWLRNPTTNLFRVSSDRFLLSDVEIDTAETQTAGSVIVAEGSQGSVRHVRLDGNFFNGFTLDQSRAGAWSFEDIRALSIGPWNYFLHLQSEKPTVASTHLHNIFIGVPQWRSACIILDSGVDTFVCSDCELGSVWLRDSLNVLPPRWVRFSNTFIEAGPHGRIAGTALRIDAGRDVRYQGYIATSENGIVLGPRATNVEIANTEFVNIGRSAITVGTGATAININNNNFDDTANEADGVYDAVSVDQSVSGFQIHNNAFHTAGRNRPRFLIHVSGGNNDYAVTGNRFGAFATAAIDDRGTGAKKVVERNY